MLSDTLYDFSPSLLRVYDCSFPSLFRLCDPFLQNKGCPELKTMKQQCDTEGLFRGIDHVSKVLPTNYTKSTTDKQLNGTAGGGESAKGQEKGRRRRQLLAEPEEPELYSGEEDSPQCIGPMQVGIIIPSLFYGCLCECPV